MRPAIVGFVIGWIAMVVVMTAYELWHDDFSEKRIRAFAKAAAHTIVNVPRPQCYSPITGVDWPPRTDGSCWWEDEPR